MCVRVCAGHCYQRPIQRLDPSPSRVPAIEVGVRPRSDRHEKPTTATLISPQSRRINIHAVTNEKSTDNAPEMSRSKTPLEMEHTRHCPIAAYIRHDENDTINDAPPQRYGPICIIRC